MSKEAKEIGEVILKEGARLNRAIERGASRRMVRVYIAGPFSGSNETLLRNVRFASLVAHDLMDRGYAPFCPHLFAHLHLIKLRPREDWIRQGLAWVRACDAVIRLYGNSAGADKEVELAQELGIPVFEDVTRLVEKMPPGSGRQ